jgi:glycerol-3-phosphate dehydrogenase
MRRDLKRLAEDTFDILVVGGGVNGLAVAWDAALRGFNVALVERGDFGGATSAHSLKIIHGGLRHLQHLDLPRMRRAIFERSALMRIAPHLIEPLAFLVPAYGLGARSRWAMRAAGRVNDMMGWDRNRHLAAVGRHLPNGYALSRADCVEQIPCLEGSGLAGGVVFYDGQMWNADRVTLGFAISAAARGALLINYAEMTGFIEEGMRIAGVEVRDRESGATLAARARITLNMTGPWSLATLQRLGGPERRPERFPLSKGFQFVTRNLTGELGLAVSSTHANPRTLVKRRGRHYFISPWRGHALVGTTDVLHEGDPDAMNISPAEVAAFVDEINAALPGAGLDASEIRHAFGGLQPADPRRLGRGAQVAAHPLIIDHERTLKRPGLMTVIGVKYTACRWLAQRVMDRVCRKLGYEKAPCTTYRVPLVGGDLKLVNESLARIAERSPAGLAPEVAAHLARTYGSQVSRLWSLIEKEPSLGEGIEGSRTVLRAQVIYAARHEAALHLADVVMRRTDLGTAGHPGHAALRDCAATLAGELGWDEERVQRELNDVERCFPLGVVSPG